MSHAKLDSSQRERNNGRFNLCSSLSRDHVTKTVFNTVGVYYNRIPHQTQIYAVNQYGFCPVCASTTIRPQKYNKNGLNRLNDEIERFCEEIKPTDNDQQSRETVVRRVTDAIASCLPHAKVDVFGSFKTGLYLPTSDIDVVVKCNNQPMPYIIIRDALIRTGVCNKEDINIHSTAVVPIIKLADKLMGIKVDIVFNTQNAEESAKYIQSCVKKFPVIEQLIIVLKQFLVQRELNEVFRGGLSSYSLFLLILCFLKNFTYTYNRGYMNPRESSAEMLLNFLRFYAYEFNSLTCFVNPLLVSGISIKFPESWNLSIADPLNIGNDVARGSYNFYCIQQAFGEAFRTLLEDVNSNNYRGSILPGIIRTTFNRPVPPFSRPDIQIRKSESSQSSSGISSGSSDAGSGTSDVESGTSDVGSGTSDVGSSLLADTESDTELAKDESVKELPSLQQNDIAKRTYTDVVQSQPSTSCSIKSSKSDIISSHVPVSPCSFNPKLNSCLNLEIDCSSSESKDANEPKVFVSAVTDEGTAQDPSCNGDAPAPSSS